MNATQISLTSARGLLKSMKENRNLTADARYNLYYEAIIAVREDDNVSDSLKAKIEAEWAREDR